MRILRPGYSRDSGPVLRSQIRDALAKSQQAKTKDNLPAGEAQFAPTVVPPGSRDTYEKSNKAPRKATAKPSQDVYIPAPYWEEIVSGKALLLKGHEGSAVTQLQNNLCRHEESTVADGKFGSSTERAVRSFQAKNRLLVTGRLDEVTLAWLSKNTK